MQNCRWKITPFSLPPPHCGLPVALRLEYGHRNPRSSSGFLEHPGGLHKPRQSSETGPSLLGWETSLRGPCPVTASLGSASRPKSEVDGGRWEPPSPLPQCPPPTLLASRLCSRENDCGGAGPGLAYGCKFATRCLKGAVRSDTSVFDIEGFSDFSYLCSPSPPLLAASPPLTGASQGRKVGSQETLISAA